MQEYNRYESMQEYNLVYMQLCRKKLGRYTKLINLTPYANYGEYNLADMQLCRIQLGRYATMHNTRMHECNYKDMQLGRYV